MSINKKEYEKLLDDIKIISKSIKIIRDENDPENRKYACGLAEDLINRLYSDITDMQIELNSYYQLKNNINITKENS